MPWPINGLNTIAEIECQLKTSHKINDNMKIDLDEWTSKDLEEYAKRAGVTEESVVLLALKLHLRIKSMENKLQICHNDNTIKSVVEFNLDKLPETSTAGLLIY